MVGGDEIPTPKEPGGSDFRDVTAIFASASKEMDPGSIIAIDGFSLNDAMSAIEIGEPRLDTGMQMETVARPEFDPLTPLLPQEICWIIDQSLAYEIEWHASSPLAHTIFTMLHVHYLEDLDPDVLPFLLMINLDPARPLELITIVLRAWTCGLLKSCNLAWTDLSKGILKDNEDWQSDKSEVSLLEGWPVNAAVTRLDSALSWLSTTTKGSSGTLFFTVSPLWNEALKTRLKFRRVILLLMNSTKSLPTTGCEEFTTNIQIARRLLSIIRADSLSELKPLPSSPAYAAFDPYIARKLNTFLPVRVIDVPSSSQVYDSYEKIFDGWEEFAKLSRTYDITAWDLVGCQQSWFNGLAARPAYIRSLTQTLFYDGIQVLHSKPPGWVADCLFKETIGASYAVFARHWGGPGSPSLLELERAMIRVLIPHIQNQWNNPSRRRRSLGNSIMEWHMVYEQICVLIEGLDTSVSVIRQPIDMDPLTFRILNQFPKAIVLWRLTSIREVILSGFQLELYHPMERPFAYWFASQVIDVHLGYLDVLLSDTEDSPGRKEMLYQRDFLGALQSMSLAMFVLLIRNLPRNSIFTQWEQLRANLRRRYKWAFNVTDDILMFEPVVMEPDFVRYLKTVQEVQDGNDDNSVRCKLAWALFCSLTFIRNVSQQSSLRSPSKYFERSESLLHDLIASKKTGVLWGSWGEDRLKVNIRHSLVSEFCFA
ncbi:Mak10 subunit, NatC N-terminal acetyltransferase-domain-containing protein [Rhodocollybia butyracea]|uniref:Mak10 subunit, NatC N-terminal acetyltransferase-domain-containing protein n=1 Tax=Rhodocollybia butyracea TaxID=206335 RepID=A0A9P5PJQ9_9AGAR|nr:Mak10 subunit, NatC N-terminal acetyltransferase-domain-containing protein [Rhodocollybia butyracea]